MSVAQPAAAQGVAYVRSAANFGESVRYTVSIAPTAGDFLGVFVWQTEGAATPSAMTDNLGSVYTKDCDLTYVQTSGSRRLTVYHLLNVPSGITAINVTPNKASRAIVAEYSGMPTTGTVLDICGAVNNQTSAVTTWSSAATTTTANDLVFGLADSTLSGSVGYSASGTWAGRLPASDTADGDESYLEDKISVAAGSYTATGTTTVSATESSVVVAFKTPTTTSVAPSITSASNTTFTVGTAGSFTITATGSPAPTFSESGSLPSGVTFSAAGVLSGTPAAGTAGSYALTITAQNGVGTNAKQTFTLTVNQAPAVTSASSTTFTLGTAGSFTVTASGVPAPTLSESGTLPSGVTFTAATGVLSGTPTIGGSYPITFTAQNGVGSNATQSFTLTVNQAPAITSASSATLTVGTAGSFTVTASGSPAPTFSESGPLPSGVTFTAAGILSGTAAVGTAGNYPITITAQNGVGTNATQSFTLTVNQAPAITSASSTTFTLGTAGSFTVTATGTPSPTLSESGALPAGVTFTAATGVLGGTPTIGGSYPITFTAQNGVGSNATQSFTLTVNQAPAITSASSATLTVGTAGSFTVTATGTPAPTFSESGSLPSGVTFSAAGVLSGTPAAGTAGSYALTITAQNGVGTNATQSFTLTVNPAVAAPVAYVRSAASFGGSARYTVSIAPTAGDFLGVFVWQTEGAATPSAMTDNLGSVYTKDCDLTYVQTSGSRRLTVYHLLNVPSGITAINVTPNKASRAIVAEYSGMPTTGTVLDICGAVNNQTSAVTTWSSAATTTTANDLVFGLADSTLSGSVGYSASGTWAGRLPASDTADGDESYLEDKISVAAGSYTATGTTTVSATESSVVVAFKTPTTTSVAPSITSASNTTFTVGTAGSFTVTATGSPAPTFSESGSLPSGVTFSAAGVLSGTPAAGTAGSYALTITAQNGVGTNATQSFTLTVNQAPAITSASSTTFTLGTAGSFTVTASGVPAPTLSESGTLPSGVTFTAATGMLSGTPMIGGSYPITITAQNGVGSNATQSFTLTVNQAPAITSASSTTFTLGTAGSFTVTATGSPAPTFSESGSLPSGVTFTAAGILSGTAAVGTAGSYPITITAQNGVGTNATQSFTLTVNQAPAITSASSTTFTLGTAGSFTVTATGTPSPTLSESGALPAGVTFTAATGVLGGTPTIGGSYPITFTAQNGVGSNATQSFTLTVNQAPAITSASSATLTVGTAGSFTVTATGTPAPTFSESGSLPSGVTFSAAGVLSGTPAAGTAGSYALTITAQNGVGTNATQSFTLTVNPAVAAPVAYVRSAASFGGSARYTVSIAPTAGDFLGVFVWQTEGAATPSAMTDNLGSVYTKDCDLTYVQTSGSRRLTVYHLLNVPSGITAINVTPNKASRAIVAEYSGMPTTGTVLDICGAVNNQTSAVTTWSSAATTTTANDLVFGLADSTLSGSVGYSASGTWAGRLPASDTADGDESYLEDKISVAAGSYTATGTTTVSATESSVVVAFKTPTTTSVAPSITSASSTTFTVGTAGSFTVTATGFPTPALSESGTLPSGVTFTAATGKLAGTPAAGTAGSYPLTITAQNGVGANASQSFILTVNQAPAITSASSATFVVGAAGSFTVVATGSPAPTFSELGSLPSGVTLSAAGALSGIAAAGTAGSYPVTITAQNGAGANALQSFTLIVSQAPAITSANNTTFTVGTPGSFTVTATGSPTPTFSESGPLPSGVTLTAAGVLSGTPAAGTAGSYPVTITAQNGVGANATQSFTLTVNQVSAITSANNTTFTVGTPGSFTVTATGSPTPTFSESGSLPSGVTLTAAGVLSGTPATGTAGSYPITITAQNGVGTNATQSFTLTVNQVSAITSANNTTFTVGTPGSFTVTATGSPTPTFSESGPLPSGVTLTAAGLLSGTPAAGTAGSYPITITAQNGVGTNATQSFTLTVNQVSAITSANNTTFTVGTPGSFTVTATGSPTPTFSESGSLPSGVTLTAAGVLSGTPAAGTAGSYAITITAQNGVGTNATQTFSLTVNQSLAITSASNATFTVGTAGSFTVTATGAPAPTLSESGTLPSGVIFTATTGVLSGTPASGTGGTYPITITAQNGVGSSVTQSFTLTVNQAPAITSSTHTTFRAGTAVSFTVTATGFPAPAISESGTLPSGVTFNSATGVLSGMPATGTSGSYPLIFTADNSVGTDATQHFTLTVNQPAAITSAGSVIFGAGTMGSFTVTATGSPTPTLSEAGTLPSGVTFVASSGLLSGTPAAGTAGTYPITFTAHNGVGASATQSFTFIVGLAPVITSAGSATFGVGALDSFTVEATGAPTPTLSVTGTLPSGVTFNASTGILSGTPATGAAGTYPITFTAQNGVGTNAAQSFTLTVGQGPIAPSINSLNSASFLAGAAASFTVTATGSPTPTLSESGTLPSGITFSTSTGILGGTAAAGTAGTYPVTFTAQNGVGANATQSFTLTVNSAPVIATQPSSQAVTAGQPATFMVAATGSAPLAYQWQSNGANISGANSSAYTTPATTAANDGTQFDVIVSNSLGSVVSTAATLNVNTAPSITSEPTNQTVAVGEAGTFSISISVSGNLPLGVQWYLNNTMIPGATSLTYTTPVITAQSESGEQFSVVVSNSLETAPSAPVTLTVVPAPSPAIYYVDFESGADTNSGISKEAPWQYAPGMNSCAYNCALTVLQSGSQVIFKGGVTWDASGFPMVVSWSGASGGPIYYGVDQTWFDGTSWTRPAFDLTDGTWSTAPVSVESSDFVTFDNLEIRNAEVVPTSSWPPLSSITIDGGSNITIQNCYIHGWSIQNPGTGSDSSPSGGIAFFDGSTGGAVQNCVLDGSPESDSGIGIYGGASIQGNIIENVPNGIFVTDPAANVSRNQVFDIPYSVDPGESSNSIFVQSSASVYNNIVHDLVPGASAIYLEAGAYGLGNTQYVYNNLIWNVGDDSPISVDSSNLGPNSTSNQFIYNNTLSGASSGCVNVTVNFYSPTNLTAENNHCISDLPSSQAWCWNNAGGSYNCGPVTNVTFSNNVLTTSATAASEGYVIANSFQPSSPTSVTVGVGLNLTSSCAMIGSSLCSDFLGVARPAGSSPWDAGAYLYQAGDNVPPDITTEPVRQAVAVGASATFTVVATGTGPPTYQWQANGVAIAGAISSAYATPAARASDDGTVFTVVVSNTLGSIVSSPAILSVNTSPGQLTASPTALAFGTLNIGTSSALNVALTNSSSSYVTISSISISGPGFTLNGVPDGTILAAGETANLTVVFAPSGSGAVLGTVTINSDASGSPTSIPLSGTGIVPPYSVSLTWTPSASPSVFGYNVYWATTTTGPYTRLNFTPVAISQYTDVTVQLDTTYLYWVTAVDSDGVESAFSVTSPPATIPSQ